MSCGYKQQNRNEKQMCAVPEKTIPYLPPLPKVQQLVVDPIYKGTLYEERKWDNEKRRGQLAPLLKGFFCASSHQHSYFLPVPSRVVPYLAASTFAGLSVFGVSDDNSDMTLIRIDSTV